MKYHSLDQISVLQLLDLNINYMYFVLSSYIF